ncbi:hypothetical protein DITRI_Ditri19aG0120100 [Diplodiscus trichospermus]
MRFSLPNCFTFPIVLKSCLKCNALKEGEEVHCVVMKSGFKGDPFVGTTLIEMYSGLRVIGAAYRVFSEMVDGNVVAWTSIINGFILCHDLVKAQSLFDLAPKHDIVLWNTMISGYIGIGDMAKARNLFDQMPKRDVMSWNTILLGYAINEDIETCERLFEVMPERNVFSWNGLMEGYARNECFLEVLDAFKRMLVDGNVHPNDVTLVIVLSACARLGALDLGKWVHLYAENNGYKGNVYVGNALIDLYAKCGLIKNAIDVFKSMDNKDLISWNTIIGGLAMHGRGADALDLFFQMKNSRVIPDGITFIGVLCACTHMGLVEDGILYFQSMVDDYSIEPQIEHYGCMVNLLARAGLLPQALDFVKKMPIEADAVIWAALLGACRVYKHVEFAELALEQLIKLEPKNPANFVTLANIYGDLGRWKDVARLKIAMRNTGYKKAPGCSLIEVDNDMVEFYSLDEGHPRTKEIYGALRGLNKLLRSCFGCEDIRYNDTAIEVSVCPNCGVDGEVISEYSCIALLKDVYKLRKISKSKFLLELAQVVSLQLQGRAMLDQEDSLEENSSLVAGGVDLLYGTPSLSMVCSYRMKVCGYLVGILSSEEEFKHVWGKYIPPSSDPPGFVYLDVEEATGIQRDGINLSSMVSISYLHAILGSIVKFIVQSYPICHLFSYKSSFQGAIMKCTAKPGITSNGETGIWHYAKRTVFAKSDNLPPHPRKIVFCVKERKLLDEFSSLSNRMSSGSRTHPKTQPTELPKVRGRTTESKVGTDAEQTEEALGQHDPWTKLKDFTWSVANGVLKWLKEKFLD